jgi:uncharacterized membrane protein
MVNYSRIKAILENENWLQVTQPNLLIRGSEAIKRVTELYKSIEGYEYLAAIRDLCQDGLNGDRHYIKYQNDEAHTFIHLTFPNQDIYEIELIVVLSILSNIAIDRFLNSEDDKVYIPGTGMV